MEIRKATKADIDLLVENRMEFVKSIRDIANEDEFKIETKKYLDCHLEDDSMLCYIGVDEGKIVSSCILCIYQTLPTPSSLSGKNGLLLNVYTVIDYRRRGFAKKLLTQLIQDAKSSKLSRIHLDYTEDGYPLYCSLGFVKKEHEMSLNL